jgi:hypothetical protein
MKVCNANRQTLYRAAAAAFESLAIQPVAVELGVLRGENAQDLQQALNPQRLFLVDAWSAKSLMENYSPFSQLPSWVTPVTNFAHYFGGPLDDQATFDRLYDECATRFHGQPQVQLVRGDTVDEFPRVRELLGGDASIDFLYLDANHQYEFVFRELMEYARLCKPDALIMLNDCCHSAGGLRQNLGVLEAVSRFIKICDFRPVALTATDYSDLVLARSGSRIGQVMGQVLERSAIAYVEVPHQLLPAARVIYNGRGGVNISFA